MFPPELQSRSYMHVPKLQLLLYNRCCYYKPYASRHYFLDPLSSSFDFGKNHLWVSTAHKTDSSLGGAVRFVDWFDVNQLTVLAPRSFLDKMSHECRSGHVQGRSWINCRKHRQMKISCLNWPAPGIQLLYISPIMKYELKFSSM